MTRVEATAGSEAPEIEDGLYPVVVRAVEQTRLENDQFGHPDKLRFKLEIEGFTNDDGSPMMLDPLVNEKLSMPDAKMVSTLTKWAQVFGVPIVRGGIDTDDFIGKRAQALIKTEKQGDWPRVKDLMPAKKGLAPANGHAVPDTAAFLTVNPTGDAVVDWNKFWAVAKPYGINAKHVTDAAGIEKIEAIDPFDLPPILEALIAKATAV